MLIAHSGKVKFQRNEHDKNVNKVKPIQNCTFLLFKIQFSIHIGIIILYYANYDSFV